MLQPSSKVNPTGFKLSCSKVNPTRFKLFHAGFTRGFIIIAPTVITICRQGYHIDYCQDDQYGDVDDRHLSPTPPQACKHPRFARVTGVAQLALIVAPHGAIRVCAGHTSTRVPYSLIPVNVATLCWGFAATRLA